MGNLLPKCYIMIAPPAAGKTTWVNKKVQEAENAGIICILSSDNIRKELYGSASVQGNKRVWDILYARLAAAIRAKQNIIIDNTSCNAAARKEILEVFRKQQVPYLLEYIVLTTPLEVCLKRNSTRPRQVPEEVITRMHNTLHQNLPNIYEEIRLHNIKATFINTATSEEK